MRRFLKAILFVLSLTVFSDVAIGQDVLKDLNCQIDSLLGGNCDKIRQYNQAAQKINSFEEEQEIEWVSGNITAMKFVRSVYDLHRSLIAIDSYSKEDYLFRFQVARASDEGKITVERARYLMERNSNQINERRRAGQPVANIPFTCKSETFGGVTKTRCE